MLWGLWLSSGHFVLLRLWHQWPHEDTHNILSYRECDQGQSPLDCELPTKSTDGAAEDKNSREELHTVRLCLFANRSLLADTLYHCTFQWDGPKPRVHRSDLCTYLKNELCVQESFCWSAPCAPPFSALHISELGRSRQMTLLWTMRKENDQAQKSLLGDSVPWEMVEWRVFVNITKLEGWPCHV